MPLAPPASTSIGKFASRWSELGQTEKGRHRSSTAGQPPTTEVFMDTLAQPISANERHPPNLLLTAAVDPSRRLLGSSPDNGSCPTAVIPLGGEPDIGSG